MTKDQVSVSVIIPSYNQGKYLEQTLLSVIQQNYSNIEIIVLDGGSTDESVEIIRKYEKYLYYWHSVPDNGQADAVATGFEKSNGQLITYLCSDDLLMPNAIQNVLKAWDGRRLAVIYGNYIFIDENAIEQERFKSFPFIRWVWKYLNPLLCEPGTFYTKDLYTHVGGVDRSLQYAFDFDLFMKFLFNNASFIRLKDTLGAFRKHGEQKGRINSWTKIGRDEEKSIAQVYYNQRKSRIIRITAKSIYYFIQIFSLSYFYSLFFRVTHHNRIKRYR